MADPISLAVAKQHLRIDSASADEDVELLSIISAATQYAENITKRNLRGSELTKLYTSFPYSLDREKLGLNMIKGPVASVTSLKYYDSSNVQVTVDQADYRIVVRNDTSMLYPAMGSNWPSDCNNEPGNIELIYTISSTNIPSPITTAILLIVGSLYENREDGVLEQGIVSVRAPIAAKDLLSAYRLR